MRKNNPSPSVAFDTELPSSFSLPYDWLHVLAWINPGIPQTRWEPREPAFVEDLQCFTEEGKEVSGIIGENNKAWEWLEIQAMHEASKLERREDYCED